MNDDDSDGPRRASELRRALQKLTQGAGVEREDLLEALEGELVVLRQCWGLNLNRHDGEDRDRARLWVQKTIIANLFAHIDRLAPPKGKSNGEFAPVVCAGFNIRYKKEFASLKDLDLTRRLVWLAKSPPEDERVPYRTSRNYISRALDQIEQQILTAGYEPIQVEALPSDDSLESPITSQQSAPDATQLTGDRNARKRWLVVAMARALVAILAVLVIINPFRSSTTTPDPITSINPTCGTTQSPDSSASPRDQPVSIDSVTVFPNLSYATRGQLLLSDREMAELNGSSPDYQSWVTKHCGVDIFSVGIQIVLRGKSDRTVVVSNARVVKQCTTPLKGTLFSVMGNSGEDISVHLGFDLDQQLPIAQNYQVGALSEEYFKDHTISLRRGETQALFVRGLTKKQSCEFHLELTLVAGNSQQPSTLRIDNNGQPFKVTALLSQADYQAVYRGGVEMGNVWARVRPS